MTRSPAPSEIVRGGILAAFRPTYAEFLGAGGRVRLGLGLGTAASLLWFVSACSSSTGPRVTNIAGTWLDTTNYYQSANVLNITQQGDSVRIVSPGYYVSFTYNGVLWWSQEGQAANATGAILKDSLAICDADIGPPCPNETGYLRDSDLVVYLGPLPGVAWDTTGLGYTFTHQAWTPGNTTPPSGAPGPVQISNVWVSDSMSWSGTCPGVVQIGLGVGSSITSALPPTIFQLVVPLADGQSWVRQCGASSWTQQSNYFVSWLPVPCTSTDACLIDAGDTNLAKDTTDSWLLRPGGVDTLADVTPTYLNTGWLPQYFLLDSGVTSLAQVSNALQRTRPIAVGNLVRATAYQNALRRFREAQMRARRQRVTTTFRQP
jgi:hypothetical protein